MEQEESLKEAPNKRALRGTKETHFSRDVDEVFKTKKLEKLEKCAALETWQC